MLKKSILILFLFLSYFFIDVSPLLAQSPKTNPIVWKTNYSQLSSGNFHIRIGEKYFYGTELVDIRSDPGLQNSTLEVTWQENGVEMRFYAYFRMTDDKSWEMYDLRSYNLAGNDWIYYSPIDSLGNKVSSMVGQRNFASERIFKPVNSGVDADIYCGDCSFMAFNSPYIPLSSYGYGVDFRLGLSPDQTITVSTDPMTGYGVNALLVDSSYKLVLDQRDFEYRWVSQNTNVLTVNSSAIPYPSNTCAYGIMIPCPSINVQISGKNPGLTQVILDVVRRSDQIIIASSSFDVRVVSAQSSPVPTSKVSPTTSPDEQSIKEELSKLQGEVGKIRLDVQEQSKQIGLLQQIIKSIQDFLARFLGKNN